MDACQVEEKLASVGEDAELEHSGHATQQRLATAAAALLVRDMWRWQCRVKLAQWPDYRPKALTAC